MGTISSWVSYVFVVKSNAQMYLQKTPLMSDSENFNMLLKEIKLENVDSYGIFMSLFGIT
jgi:hypothetical protein